MSARDFDLDVGGTVVPCRLPMMPTRMALIVALPEPGEPGEAFVRGCVYGAALAACLATPPECGTLARHRGDVIAYGEAAIAELAGDDIERMKAVHRAGAEAWARIVESIPTAKEEEEALDPTGAPAEDSTGATSASA